jgi:branched-chain amino acid transport system permease protein
MSFETALINGIAVGSVSALLAVGISQIFTVTGVLNFAHAGFAMVAAYLYSWFTTDQGWSPAGAAAVSILIVTLLGALLEGLVLRRLHSAPFTSKVIVTLGLLVLMQGLVLQIFGFNPRRAPLLIAGGVDIAGTRASWQQLAILAVAVVLIAALLLFLRGTRLGLATRACAQDRDTADLLGIRTGVVSRMNWTIGSFLAAVAGVLIAPLAIFTTDSFSIYIVTGIGAALFGGLVGLAGAFAGGLVLGVVQNLAIAGSEQPGIWALAIFVAIAGLLVFRRRWPKELVSEALGTVGGWRGSRGWLPARIVLVTAWALLILNALRTNFWSYTASLVLVYVLLGLSVVVGAGWTGQLSLGQGALMGVGVFATLSLRNDFELPFVPALIAVLALGALAGALLGVLSLRLSPTQIAIVTLAATMAASEWLFQKGLAASESASPPEFLGSDRKLFLGLAALVVAATLILRRLAASRWGLSFSAVRDAPDMAAHFEVPVRSCRIWAFALSGVLAAAAGVGYGLLVSVVPPFAVGVPMSINVLVFTVVGGMSSLLGPFIGPLLFIAGPQVLKVSQTTATAFPQIAGGLLVLVVLMARPDGLGSFLRRPCSTPEIDLRSVEDIAPLALSGRNTGVRLARAETFNGNGHLPVSEFVLEEGGTR